MHHFISYSFRDGFEFADSVSDELIISKFPTWMNISTDGNWPEKLESKIKTCDSLIFVMTIDSVSSFSVCNNELESARRFKKPIVIIRFHSEAQLPFIINLRGFIDFSVDFIVGMARLKKHLRDLKKPEGQLQFKIQLLEEAKRDQETANESELPLIERDIDVLNSEISSLEEMINNPRYVEKSEESIRVRIEQEKISSLTPKEQKQVKFVNPAPKATANFQDRFVETKSMVDFLKNETERILTIIGRAGLGKTAMVSRLLRKLEGGILPDDLGSFDIGGIVYLSEIGIHRVSFPNLFNDLCRLLPSDLADKLKNLFEDGQKPVRSKMLTLLEEFQEKPVILLLDNLENVIDAEKGILIQEDLDEALKTILEAPEHKVKVIITTRVSPSKLMSYQAENQRTLEVIDGLEKKYAIILLRALDKDSTLGLAKATDDVLEKICVNTRGFPKALEAFYGVLSADRSTSLDELLAQTQKTLPENVVEKLVGEAFSRLDRNYQMVMQALAIYARPVPPVAVDFLLQSYIQVHDSTTMLKNLVNMHFVRKEQDRYYLHPADLEYSLRLIPDRDYNDDTENHDNTDDQEIFELHSLHLRAAEYFKQARLPRENWKKLADIEPQLAEFEKRCEAGDYESALWLLKDLSHDYLSPWGNALIVIEMGKKLLGNLKNDELDCYNLSILGNAYNDLGRSLEAIRYHEDSLTLSKAIDNRNQESITLNGLGIANRRLGNISKAIEFYEEALIIDKELFRKLSEHTVLGNLGVAYRYMGLINKSIDKYTEAWEILMELGESYYIFQDTILGNASVSYRHLGMLKDAIKAVKSSLEVANLRYDLKSKGTHLEYLSLYFYDLGNYSEAVEILDEAVEIAEKISDSNRGCLRAVQSGIFKLLIYDNPDEALLKINHGAALSLEIKNEHGRVEAQKAIAMVKLKMDEYEEALNALDNIRETEYEIHLPDIYTLSGIINLRQKNPAKAKADFVKAIEITDYLLENTPRLYGALESKGLASCGLVLCGLSEYKDNAVKCYNEARKIITEPGVIRRAMFFFDELTKADVKGIVLHIRKVVEGNYTHHESVTTDVDRSISSLEEIENLYKNNPDSTEYARNLYLKHIELGDIYLNKGKSDSAIENYEEALKLIEPLLEREPNTRLYKWELAVVYHRLGTLHQILNQIETSLKYFEQYHKLCLELYSSDPKSDSYLINLANSFINLGALYKSCGQFDQALEFFKTFVKFFEEIPEPGSKLKFNKLYYLAMAYERLGDIYQVLGKLDNALEQFKLCNEVRMKLSESKPEDTVIQEHLGISLYNIGETLIMSNKKKSGEKYLTDAARIFKKVFDLNKSKVSSQNLDNLKKQFGIEV